MAPVNRPDWPLGFRSEPHRAIWVPLVAIAAGILMPACIGWLWVWLSGSESIQSSAGLRGLILFYASLLATAPFLGVLAFPVLWIIGVALVGFGYAGLVSILSVGLLVGLGLAHVLLHGDLTTEAPLSMLPLSAALLTQGAVVWAVLWALLRKG